MNFVDRFLDYPAAYRLWQAPFAGQKFIPVIRSNDLRGIRRVLDFGRGPGTSRAYFGHTGYVGININPRYFRRARAGTGGSYIVAEGSSRTIRENVHAESFLYAGTEFEMFATIDRGSKWTRVDGNEPTNSVQEVVVQPTTGEIAIATHSRDVWSADVANLRQMTDASTHGTHLFESAAAVLWGPRRVRRSDLYDRDRFHAENHPDGAVVVYALSDDAEEVTLTIRDADGDELLTLASADLGDDTSSDGLHRVAWDLRRWPSDEEMAAQEGCGGRGGGGGGRGRGNQIHRVDIGVYQLTLTMDGQETNRTLRVLPDSGTR